MLFRFDSEHIHETAVYAGETIAYALPHHHAISFSPNLRQTLHAIAFPNPIGLAAGFDYEARLTGILPYLGFGFGTVGTITHRPYEGNDPPRLGRLVRSRSLVVNKGFKNSGIDALIQKHKKSWFSMPIGLSLGKTNSKSMTQGESVDDIVSACAKAERAHLPFAYYELNISCPNLHGSVEFYSSRNLSDLLSALETLSLSKPVFIKMPINESNEDFLRMLGIITQFKIAGIIIGNLQKDRQHPLVDQSALAAYPRGYLSGKPTEDRSNELIALAYRHYSSRFTIIGCGGVFSAFDAYKKIRYGASLVQMITGLVFEGPHLPHQINTELPSYIARDGFSHISEVIGIDSNHAAV